MLTKTEQKVIYSELYDKGNNLLKMHNPCNISADGKTCNGGYSGIPGLCCNGCKYLGPRGCTVESLACKLWLCGALQKQDTLREQLYLLDKERRSAGISSTLRGSKEDHFASESVRQERIRSSYR